MKNDVNVITHIIYVSIYMEGKIICMALLKMSF